MPISEPVTPSSTSHRPSPSSHRKPWNPVRLTILPSTPVSLRTRTPLAPISLNLHSVKRKLFYPIPVPPRKNRSSKSTPRHRSSPRTPQPAHFRVASGKERTQPVDLFSAKKRPRHPTGPLTAKLYAYQKVAKLNQGLLRTAVLAPRVDVREVAKLVEKSLFLNVVRWEGQVLIVQPWGNNSKTQSDAEELSLVLPRSVLDEGAVEVEYQGVVLYVPEPWDLTTTSPWSPSSSGIVIIAHSVGFMRIETISVALQNCAINSEMLSWHSLRHAGDSVFEVPDTQDAEEDTSCRSTVANRVQPTQCFSGVSPHAIRVNIEAVVEVVLKDIRIALIQDSNGERAIYHFGEDELEERKDPQHLPNVVVGHQRIPVSSISSLLRCWKSENKSVPLPALPYFETLDDSSTLFVFSNGNVL